VPLAAWVTRDDLPAGTPGGEAELDAACGLASAVLWGLTGRRWAGHGTRTIEVLAAGSPWWWRDAAMGVPWGTTGDTLWGGGWGLAALPIMYGGELFNVTGGEYRSIRLPDFPVRAVTAVRGWPSCGLSADRIMEVDYAYGADPPAAGRAAAARLATELARLTAGQQTALPGYVKQRVRQGETITYVDAAALFDKGRTGLGDVDLWLATVNPAGLRRRSRTWSPDTDPHYRTTTTGGIIP
jgi:hypothetical protein